jgi:hypothetical protein
VINISRSKAAKAAKPFHVSRSRLQLAIHGTPGQVGDWQLAGKPFRVPR